MNKVIRVLISIMLFIQPLMINADSFSTGTDYNTSSGGGSIDITISGTGPVVKEQGTTKVTSAGTIDFQAGFDVDSASTVATTNIDLSEIVTGDISFSSNTASVDKIKGITVSTNTPSIGQALVATSTTEVEWQNVAASGAEVDLYEEGVVTTTAVDAIDFQSGFDVSGTQVSLDFSEVVTGDIQSTTTNVITVTGIRDITVTSASPTNNYVLGYNSATGQIEWMEQTGSGGGGSGGANYEYILLKDVKTAGTGGGTFTSGAWRTRTINTEEFDTGSNVTITANQMTLEAGTYYVNIAAAASSVNGHQAILYDVDNTTTLLIGTSNFDGGVNTVNTFSHLYGKITLASQTTLEVRHKSGFNGTFGVADANLAEQCYLTIEMFKEVTSSTVDATHIEGVDISTTAPTTGQVLTATGTNTANWQTPTGGGGGKSFTVDTDGGLDRGLIAYWDMEETSANRADRYGIHHLRDVATVTYTALGKQGNAAEFTTANSEFLFHPDTVYLSIGDYDMSCAMWIKLKSLTNSYVFSKYHTTSDERSYLIWYDSGANRLKWLVSSAGTAGSMTTATASTFGALSTDTWYFVYCYSDSANNEIGISVNNGTVDTAAHTGGVYDATSQLEVGSAVGGTLNFDGYIDELGLWNKVLSSQEITDLYNSGSGNTYS